MSTGERQARDRQRASGQTITARVSIRPVGDHLTAERPPTGVKLTADPHRSEFWCTDCGKRVTVGTQGSEYGHATGCDHSAYRGGQE